MKIVTKTDEMGNLWLLLSKGDGNHEIKSVDDTICDTIKKSKFKQRLMTATMIADICGFDSSKKPVIDSVAKTMRALGYKETRRGSGKYFVMFEKQKKSDHIAQITSL